MVTVLLVVSVLVDIGNHAAVLPTTGLTEDGTVTLPSLLESDIAPVLLGSRLVQPNLPLDDLSAYDA